MAAIFPNAKFIVLIRDCYTWLESITGHLVSRDVPDDVAGFLRWWFKPERYPHGPYDRGLAARGLFWVAAHLHAWNRHVDSCIESIPADRRLILRTHELAASHRRLADFLEIPLSSLHLAGGHRNRGARNEPFTSFVAPEYIDERVRSIGGANMARHFPGLRSRRDAEKLWQ